MSDRKRILVFSILVIVGSLFCSAAVTIAILYHNTMEDEREKLAEMARGRASLLVRLIHDSVESRQSHFGSDEC